MSNFAKTAAAIGLCIAVGSCGGGGGAGDSSGGTPTSAPGMVDAAYGNGGRATIFPANLVVRMVVAADGSAYVTGSEIVKLDRNGARVPTFGDGGRVALRTWSPVLDETGTLYAMTPEGIARFDSNGRSDPAFGVNGRAMPRLPATVTSPGDFLLSHLARDAAGTLFAAGVLYNLDGDAFTRYWWVARFDRDGRPVASFGSEGARVLAFTDTKVDAMLAIAPDGRGDVYLGGRTLDPRDESYRGFVAKVDSSGNLATGFSIGGLWRSPACPDRVQHSGEVTALVANPAGGFLATVHCAGPNGHPNVLLVKTDAIGAIQSSFRDTGLRTGLFGRKQTRIPPFGDVANVASTILVAQDGAIYVGGYRGNTDPPDFWADFAVAKLDSGGNPVTSFGDEGVVTLNIALDGVRDLAMDGAGRLYVGGTSSDSRGRPESRTWSFVVYRLGG